MNAIITHPAARIPAAGSFGWTRATSGSTARMENWPEVAKTCHQAKTRVRSAGKEESVAAQARCERTIIEKPRKATNSQPHR